MGIVDTNPSKNGIPTDAFLGLPFWRWDIDRAEHKILALEKDGQCCFNHLVGLPYREGTYSPIFQWQKQIIDNYDQHKYNWVLKATGLGLTEITLRYILWKCTRSNEWNNGRICVVTGPNLELAKDLMDRIKNIIQDTYPLTNVSAKNITVNKATIEAFPSNHLDAMRGIPDVKLIFLDEADFFPKHEQQDARTISERYIAKSDPQILLVSTPNAPGGLMERIQNEKESLYYRYQYPYTIGVGTMYSEAQIKENMKSPSFEQEYNLKYLGEIGNIFHIMDIEYAFKELGTQYNPNQPNTDPFITRAMGVDPGFGSSMFGIVIQQWVDGLAEIIYADHIERGSMTECLDLVLRLVQKHRIMKIYIDGSAAGFIVDLKKAYGENRNYAQIMEEHPGIADIWIHNKDPKVVPVSFRDKHEFMLQNLELLLQKKLLRIHPQFDKLEVALRTATSKGSKYDLDKEKTSFDDILDALQLSLLNLYLSP